MTDLNSRLARAAGDVTASLDLDDLRRRADRRRRRHRAVRGVGIVGVALVVIAAAVLAVSSRSSTTEVAHPNREPAGVGVGEPGRWVPIAKAPIQPRRNAVTVWTGTDLLVFGGFSSIMGKNCYEDEAAPRCGDGSSGELRSAASYDPSTDTWRRIAPLPAGTAAYQPRSESASGNSPLARLNTQVLDGQVYVVADNEKSPTSPALLAYDLETDQWRIVTTLRTTGRETWALTAWDGRLVTYVADRRGDAIPYDRIYDPRTGQWSDAPEPPDGDVTSIGIRPSTSRQVIGVGDKLYVFATTDAVPEGQDRVAAGTSVMVAIYDGDHWSLVTHATKPLLGGGVWTVTGDHFTFVVPSHLTLPPGASHPPWGPTVITFDPVTRKFTEPQPPDTVDAHLAQGNAPVLGSGRSAAVTTSTGSLILDGDTGSWTPAVGPASAVIDDFASTWAGDQLFLWGGATAATAESEASLSGRGWLWTPPTSDVSPSTPNPSSSTVPAGTTISQLAAGSWRDLPMPPVPMGGDAGVVWTGERLFAWGGSSKLTISGSEDVSHKAAMYDPVSRKWRTTSAAPIDPRSNPTTVWTGSEVLVWGGLDASRRVVEDGAAYDPATDSWQKLPRANAPGTGTRTPGVRPTMQAAVWTGTLLAVFTQIDPTATDATTIAQSFYDPATNTWAERGPQHAVRAGKRLAGIDAVSLPNGPMLVWLSWSSTMHQRSDGSSTEGLPAVQLLYEVDTGPDVGIGWTEVSLTDSAPVITDPIVTGDVVAATTNPYWLSPAYRGPAPSGIPTVLLSLNEGRSGPAATWKEMPQGSLNTTSQPQVWTGDAIIRFNVEGRPSPTSRQQPGDLDALDWNNHAWTALPRSPWDADPETLRLVWAGDRLILWGQLSTTCANQAHDCTPGQGRRILATELDPG